MPAAKPVAATIGPWLRANGMRLGGLCGQDWPAIQAAVQVIDLYAQTREPHVLAAFSACVRQICPERRYLAYHAIAHVMDWDVRRDVWVMAGLEMADVRGQPECANAPRCGAGGAL